MFITGNLSELKESDSIRQDESEFREHEIFSRYGKLIRVLQRKLKNCLVVL